MKYINKFTSIEDYITYKENNPNLEGVNQVECDDINNSPCTKYPNSFVFLEDEYNTNYNIIKYNSHEFDIHFNNVDIIAQKQLNPTELLTEDSVLITKNYKWNELKTIPSYFGNGENKLNKIVYLPDTVETIESLAFDDCVGLHSIVFPKKLKIIEDYAFKNCYNINSLTFYSVQKPNFDFKNAFFINHYENDIPESCIYPNITSLILPSNSIANYNSLINDIIDARKENGFPTVTINDTTITCTSPVYVDVNKKDSIVLGLSIFDSSWNEVNIFAEDGGTYIFACAAYYGDIDGILDNLTNEECSELIEPYIETVNIPATQYKKDYTIICNYLGQSTSKTISQFSKNTSATDKYIKVQTPVNYLGFNLDKKQEYPTVYDEESGEYTDYKSFALFTSKNKGKHNSYSTITIRIRGYANFSFYIRSYAESNYDYVMVSQLDTQISGNTLYSNTSLVKAHTRGNQNSETDITNYTKVEFNNIDTINEHFITVVYRKDVSADNGTDMGYILIPDNNLQIIYQPVITIRTDEYGWNDDGEMELGDDTTYRRFTSSNQGLDSTMCRMRIDINGLDTFGFYIGSSSENTWDFVGVRLDKTINYNEIQNDYGGTSSSWYEYGYWDATSVEDFSNINSGDISEYNYVEFTGLNNEPHFIEIAYVKDGSSSDGTDSGFIAIPNNYEFITNIISYWDDCRTDGTDIPCDCDGCDCDGCDYCDSCDGECDCDWECDCDGCDGCDYCEEECDCEYCEGECYEDMGECNMDGCDCEWECDCDTECWD